MAEPAPAQHEIVDDGERVSVTPPPKSSGVGAAGIAVPVVVSLLLIILLVFIVRTRRAWAREKRTGLRNRFIVGPDGSEDGAEMMFNRHGSQRSHGRPIHVRSKDQGGSASLKTRREPAVPCG